MRKNVLEDLLPTRKIKGKAHVDLVTPFYVTCYDQTAMKL